MYKAGQLITIDKKVFRITKNTNYIKGICSICCGCYFDYIDMCRNNVCWSRCIQKLPSNCYLKLVKI